MTSALLVLDWFWSELPGLDSIWPVTLLLLRVLIALLLYLFLFAAVRALYAELRPAAAPVVTPAPVPPPVERPRPRTYNAIEIVGCDGAGDLVGRRYPLERVSAIGRSPSSTAILDDPRVSARHAQLVARDGVWWIEDVGSRNGTYLNGQRIRAPRTVDEDAELRFGPVVARLTEDGRAR